MSQYTGAEIIIKLLERQGVEIVAGMPGGANLPLYDALFKSDRIRHVLARHEQGAGFIAQGMARISGKPEVCFGTSGPGATNLVTAIADAKLDSIPLVCITGQVPGGLIGTDAFQEVDAYGLGVPVTKHNYLVRDARELLTVLPEAFGIAASGRPGPVWIDIPKDVQNATCTVDSWPAPGHSQPAAPANGDAAAITRAVERIRIAERPILYVGGGLLGSRGEEELVALAEKTGIPVTTTLMGLGLLPHSHPLNLGMLGMHAARFTNHALERCDLLIAVGVRFDDRATGKVETFCPEAEIIHVDIDASEIGKIRAADIGIRADARTVLADWLEQLPPLERRDWVGEIVRLRSEFPLELEGVEDPRRSYGIIHRSGQLAGEDAIVTTDVGQHQMRVAQAYPFARPRRWLTSGGLGTMGFGLPAAIGAALAEPEATVLCFSGDGSFLLNCQELATLREENLKVKIILLDNRGYGLVNQQQDLFYGKRRFAVEFEHPVDFVQLAASFGIAGFSMTAADAEARLETALEAPGPSLIHVPAKLAEKVFPMVAPGGSNADMITNEPA
ncbi:MAG: biosynthetic-type acetolactate synthase large subunit [Opitutales bacterium]